MRVGYHHPVLREYPPETIPGRGGRRQPNRRQSGKIGRVALRARLTQSQETGWPSKRIYHDAPESVCVKLEDVKNQAPNYP